MKIKKQHKVTERQQVSSNVSVFDKAILPPISANQYKSESDQRV